MTISSATNSLVIDCLASSRTTSAVGAGQTQQVADDVAGSIPVVRMSSEAGAASVEMSWTLTIDNNDWGLVAVSIAPDAVPFHRLRLRGIGGGIGRGM